MSLIEYKCPNCGGPIKFDPQQGLFTCEYCKSKFAETDLNKMTEKQEQKESQKPAEENADDSSEDAKVYTCPSCGATIVTDATTAATFCYYCHNPVVLSGRLEGRYKPDYVVPFKIDRKKALEIFEEWIKNKKYVPREFYSKDQIEKFTGVYFPYLLYTCRIDGEIDAQATKKTVSMAGNIESTTNETYHVVRRGNMEVKHVMKNALKKVNSILAECVLPFDASELKPFNMSYLSGFLAEKRDMEKEDFAETVEQEVREYAAAQLKASASQYDNITVTKDNTKLVNPKWEYALMPVWTLTYNDNGKIYYFSINGQTGKTIGELPVDERKIKKTFLLIFLIMGFALALFFFLIFGGLA